MIAGEGSRPLVEPPLRGADVPRWVHRLGWRARSLLLQTPPQHARRFLECCPDGDPQILTQQTEEPKSVQVALWEGRGMVWLDDVAVWGVDEALLNLHRFDSLTALTVPTPTHVTLRKPRQRLATRDSWSKHIILEQWMFSEPDVAVFSPFEWRIVPAFAGELVGLLPPDQRRTVLQLADEQAPFTFELDPEQWLDIIGTVRCLSV